MSNNNGDEKKASWITHTTTKKTGDFWSYVCYHSLPVRFEIYSKYGLASCFFCDINVLLDIHETIVKKISETYLGCGEKKNRKSKKNTFVHI